MEAMPDLCYMRQPVPVVNKLADAQLGGRQEARGVNGAVRAIYQEYALARLMLINAFDRHDYLDF